MHQLILGPDNPGRDKILRGLKARFLKTPDALKFDYSGLDAQGLDFHVLKAALLTLPAVAERRIILISRAQKLDDHQLGIIEHVICLKTAACVIVLEAANWDRHNPLRKSIAEKVELSAEAEPETAFDLLNGLRADTAGSLVRLQALLEREPVESVLGATRWWWANKAKRSIPAARYKKGLLVVQEADERIKLSKLLPKEQLIEVAWVKLSSLIKA